MQKPLENTSISFQRPTSAAPFLILAAVLAAILIAGIVIAAIGSHWVFVAIFSVSLVGLLVYAAVSGQRIGRLSTALGQGSIEWSAAMPDTQRQTLNIEVRELCKILEVEGGQISDLQSAYIVAEDLALRQIQYEEGVPLMRHVSVVGVPFDAVYLKDGVLVCCEAAFLVSPELRKDRVEAMMRKITQANAKLESGGKPMSVRLMILLVTQLVPRDEEILRSALSKNRFAETPVDIDIRLLDFEALQKIYVTE